MIQNLKEISVKTLESENLNQDPDVETNSLDDIDPIAEANNL